MPDLERDHLRDALSALAVAERSVGHAENAIENARGGHPLSAFPSPYLTARKNVGKLATKLKREEARVAGLLAELGDS